MIKLTRRYRSFKDLRSDPNGFLLLIFEGSGFRNKKDLFVSFSDFIICLERVIKDSESINKRYLYRFFDHLFKEGSYEIFENREALGILELICKFHYGWRRDISGWRKRSRNPFKQLRDLISYLFCEYEVSDFLYDAWFGSYELGKRLIYIKWFIHLGSGNSSLGLGGLGFDLTRRIAHNFITNICGGKDIEDVLIGSIMSCSGGEINWGLHRHLCSIVRLRDGLFNKDEGFFWVEFIKYFSVRWMFDPVHISHIADYIYSKKFDRSLGQVPEQPNFNIMKKDLGVLIEDSERWVRQMNALARNFGRVDNNNRNSFIGKAVGHRWEKLGIGEDWVFTKKKILDGWGKVNMEFYVVELCDGMSLLEEGKIMKHCVLSYVGSCVKGLCRIFSMRERFTCSIVLTIEVRKEMVVQVKGKSNRQMDRFEEELIKSWAVHCNFIIKV